MNMHPMHEPGGTTADAGNSRDSALRRMTAEQLLHLGARQVLYLKTGICNGEVAFVLYGADGTPFMVAEDVEMAMELAAERGLQFVAVH